MKFGSHPLNLTLRFLLELTALFALGYWGYKSQSNFLKYVLMLALPVIVAVVWGVFAVPNDPSRSGKTIVATPGWVRLIIELMVFGLGVLATYYVKEHQLSLYFGVVVLLHYVMSYDRVIWLINQK